MPIRFEVVARAGSARRGRLATPHGVVETPAFMPVGTLGAVKGLGVDDLERAGATILLSNLYHLSLRPGISALEERGGLHRFVGWDRPMLTDSGGYQVFSLAHRRKLDRDGVTFRNHIDGAKLRFTPEGVVEAQRRIGVDLAMVLDDCPPWPIDEKGAARATARTLDWARLSREEWDRCPGPGGQFGIVQGSGFRGLREEAARDMVGLDFDGYAIGGVSVGEGEVLKRSAVEWTAPLLPDDRPRYLMGLGTPDDIRHAVSCGVDLFDCVLPTRNARHGVLWTPGEVLRIKNAKYRTDDRPVDEDCPCEVCARTSRAFLHHLFRTKEITGPVLATRHNLRFYLDFMAELREGIGLGNPPGRGSFEPSGPAGSEPREAAPTR